MIFSIFNTYDEEVAMLNGSLNICHTNDFSSSGNALCRANR